MSTYYKSALALVGASKSDQLSPGAEDASAEATVTIGPRAVIQAFAVVYDDVVIGADVIVNHHSVICSRTRIGSRAMIKPHSFIGFDVSIANDCRVGGFVANGTVIGEGTRSFGQLLHNNRRAAPSDVEPAPRVGRLALIGRGGSLIGGVTVNDYAVVGANTVVTEDIPASAIVVGNPSRIIGYRSSDEIRELERWLG